MAMKLEPMKLSPQPVDLAMRSP
ncbi:MAG: hypothetical protein QG574_1060, partial [Cyanobacteriota bacterium erpe_2018_sw_21hr_WHONDRS-SW48-000092_B_bin.40]|nr:hypothetical protein [Cyanobacteriota bacterium erpe_2018_sw_21hr_WHONDRS-SW48-000092_B_bin.40]